MRLSGILLCVGFFAGSAILFLPVFFLPDDAEGDKRHARLRQRFETLKSTLADIKARQRIKHLFSKRRRLNTLNSTAHRIHSMAANSTTNLTNRTLKLHADAALVPHWNFQDVTDMFDVLATAAQREAHTIGLLTKEWKRKKGPPPLSELG
jgi:hypothetical protein